MKNKKVKMKGLSTPTVVEFLHGFFDGRFRAAGIDQDSGLLNSAYTNGKIDLFYKYCNERVDRLEIDIASICTEAETLLMELATTPETCPCRGTVYNHSWSRKKFWCVCVRTVIG